MNLYTKNLNLSTIKWITIYAAWEKTKFLFFTISKLHEIRIQPKNQTLQLSYKLSMKQFFCNFQDLQKNFQKCSNSKIGFERG